MKKLPKKLGLKMAQKLRHKTRWKMARNAEEKWADSGKNPTQQRDKFLPL